MKRRAGLPLTGPDAPAVSYLAGLNVDVAAVEGQIARLTPSWIWAIGTGK